MERRPNLVVTSVNAAGAELPRGFVRRVIRLAAAVPEIAARLAQGTTTMAVRLTDDAELRALNRRFARSDHATDVLSFAAEGPHIGDLAISWDAVIKQAALHGHEPEAELALLCVHGLLHLLGWDHARGRERAEMWRLTQIALERAGVHVAVDRI